MTSVENRSAQPSVRRSFLVNACVLGAAYLLADPSPSVAEPAPELKTIRLVKADAPDLCFAAQYLAGDLLMMEGFSEVQYAPLKSGNYIDVIDRGHADLTMDTAQTIVYGMDTHKSVVALAGIHSGCYELFGNERIQSIRALKGRTIGIYAAGGGDHVLLASMLAYVGVDPNSATARRQS